MRSIYELNVLASRVIAKIRRAIINTVTERNYVSLYKSEILKPNFQFTKIKSIKDSECLEYTNVRYGNLEGEYFDSKSLYIILNCEIDLLTGIVFSKKRILKESSSWPVENLLYQSIPKPMKSRKLDTDQLAVVLPSNGYYHWLLEDLPDFLLTLIHINESQPIYIYKNAPKYVRDILTLKELKYKEVERFAAPRQLYLVNRSQNTGWPSKNSIELLRATFLGYSKIETDEKNSSLNNHVYVSRLESSRSPKFESELCRYLESKGWKIIYSEKLSLTRQIAVFSEARVVCGVHGAGLANSVFMKKGSYLIELSPERFVPCFSRIAELVELNYSHLVFRDRVDEINVLISKIEETLQSISSN